MFFDVTTDSLCYTVDLYLMYFSKIKINEIFFFITFRTNFLVLILIKFIITQSNKNKHLIGNLNFTTVKKYVILFFLMLLYDFCFRFKCLANVLLKIWQKLKDH